MISKREWYAALRRMLKRAALWFGGLVLQRMALMGAGIFMMSAMFYWLVWAKPLDAAIMAVTSLVLTGYGFA